MKDLQTGKEINFANNQGQLVQPGIAFTAASTMKIPIMVSVLQRLNDGGNDEQKQLLQLMIERSENDPADRLMEVVIDKNLGPLEVTKDLQQLGLVNTFIPVTFMLAPRFSSAYKLRPTNVRISTPALIHITRQRR